MSDIRVWTTGGWKEVPGTPDGRLLVSSQIREIEDSKLLAATTNYVAEDVLSESATNGVGTAWVFSDMGESGAIRKAMVEIQTTALTPQITLYLFSAKPTSELDDNAANAAPSIADWPFYQGRIDFPALEDLGGVSASVATESTYGNLPLLYSGCKGRLYGIAVTRTAITGETANDKMSIKLTREVYS